MNKFITQQQILNFIFVWKQFLWNNYILKSTYIYIFFFFCCHVSVSLMRLVSVMCQVERERRVCMRARAPSLKKKKRKKEMAFKSWVVCLLFSEWYLRASTHLSPPLRWWRGVSFCSLLPILEMHGIGSTS